MWFDGPTELEMRLESTPNGNTSRSPPALPRNNTERPTPNISPIHLISLPLDHRRETPTTPNAKRPIRHCEECARACKRGQESALCVSSHLQNNFTIFTLHNHHHQSLLRINTTDYDLPVGPTIAPTIYSIVSSTISNVRVGPNLEICIHVKRRALTLEKLYSSQYYGILFC